MIIEKLKKEYNLEDCDLWCIFYKLDEVYEDDYNHIPDNIIDEISNSIEIEKYLTIIKF